jgi:outer membrane protein assembly factor BamB
MSRHTIRLLTLAAILVPFAVAAGGDERPDPLDQWAGWRGPLASGVAPRGNPPATWSEQENVRWKTALPGLGHSTPIIWGDRVYLTAAVAHGEAVAPHRDHDEGAHDNLASTRRQKFVVLGVDRRNGRILWETTVRDERPHEGTHSTGSWASNSPVTDGEQLFVSFGSRGIFALDPDGKVVWQTDLGDMQTRHGHGEGSSPALHGDTLVVNWDHQGESFLVALDKRNGMERWRVARDEITSWSTPLIVEHAGKNQIVVAATKRVRAYDLETGAEIWQVGGLSRNVVASPVAADGMIFVANSYDWQAMLAIRLSDAAGDITGTDAVVWTRSRDTPYVPSPLLDGDRLCFTKHIQGFLTCVNAKNGETLFGPVRLPGLDLVFASPAAGAGRMYIPGRSGATAVVKLGGEFELLALNRLDDSFSASPVIVGDALFLRGERHLYCIAEERHD